MKRILLTSLLFVILIVGASAQTMTFHISGYITNSVTQAPVVNHQVYIVADSTTPPYLNYFATVTTNSNGYYEANVNLTTTSVITFYVHTYDCNGVLHSAQGNNANSWQLTINFAICGATPPPCTATFVAIQDSINSNLYHFVATATGNVTTFQWGFGDGTSGTGAYTNHIYSGPGYYVVCLHVNGANCQFAVCDTIIITGTPPPCSANFAFAPCQNSLYCFHFEATSPDPTTQYLWTFGDNTGVATTANPYHTFTQPGTYLVCLRIWTANGCQDSVCQSITVGAPQLYDIWGHVFVANNVLLDHGKARLFKVNNGTNAALLIGISTIDSNGTYHFNNIPAGTYYVKAKATSNSQYFGQYLPTYYPHNVHWINATPIMVPPTNNPYNINLRHVISPIMGPGMIGGSITEGFKLSESGVPAPDVDILLKPLSGDPYIYVESDVNGAFNFDNLGYDTYQVYPEVTGLTTVPAIITLNANNPSENNVNLMITPSQVVANVIDNEENINQFSIYPNPARTDITVVTTLSVATDAILSIYDLLGRQVYSENISLSRGINNLNYDLSSYDNGSYVLQLRTTQGLLSRKFTVVK